MKVMIVGDWHGNTDQAKYHINMAGDLKIQKIIQVGDFGLWTHYLDGQLFLDEINNYAWANKLSIFAVGGNHENWDHWNFYTEHHPKSKGFAYVRSRVLLAPKANSWTWDGKQFISAGGAVSIDKGARLSREKGGFDPWSGRNVQGTGARTQYWPNEQFTTDDIETIRSMHKKADYLITHDCSNFTPFTDRLKPDADSEIHRKRIDEVIKITKPEVHFHGHMHTKYDWVNHESHGYVPFQSDPYTGPSTQTYGLEADYLAMHRTSVRPEMDNWGVLDTADDSFKFRNE